MLLFMSHFSLLKLSFSGADSEAKDIDLYTPLLTAAEFGRTECFKLLLRHEACVDVQNVDGKNVVFLAAECNHPDIMEVCFNLGGQYRYNVIL